MKDWIKQLRNKQGETFLESVVSILIFSLLLLAFCTMLNASYQITKKTIHEAELTQTNLNDAVEATTGSTRSEVIFYLDEATIKQPIQVYHNKDAVSFFPIEKDTE